MPTDLLLDPLTHDIDISNGGEMIKNNPNVVAQRVKIAILLRKGEWFRNIFDGLPYQQEFFKRRTLKPIIDQTLIKYIGEVEDVSRVVNYSSEVDFVRRILKVNVSVETYNGEIIEINVGEL